MPADAGPKSDAPIKASGDAKRVDSALAAAAKSSELAKPACSKARSGCWKLNP